MDEQPASSNKAKIIAASVIIAAIAIIYIVTTVLAKEKDPAVTSASDNTSTSIGSNTAPTTDSSADTSPSSSAYKDGTYKASGSYRTPETTETIDVTLTIAGGTVTGSSVHQTPQDRESEQYQAAFKQNYQPLVVGKKLSDINLSRVSGSSLTSIGFNKALEQIKTQAQS